MDTPLAASNTPIPDPSSKIVEGNREMPKKYIRTFEGDMATIKKGGTPDLVPLQEVKSSATPVTKPVEPPTTSSVVPSTIPSSNVGHVSFSPLSIPIMKNEPPPIPTPAPEPVPEPEPAPEPTPAPLKTYESDFSDHMKESHASTATVLAAEQDAAPQKTEPERESNSSRGGLLYILAGVALLIAGGFGVYFVYTNYSTVIAPIILAPTIPAPIFVEEDEKISGTGAVLLSAIEQSIDRPLALNTVRLLYTENATTTDNSVFSALQIPAPNILLRNIHASDSMAGIVNNNGNQSPFFILSVASYSDTFSGMLSWEPLMRRDLGALFSPYNEPLVVAPAIAIASTTPAVATTTVATSTQATTTSKSVMKTSTTTTAVATSSTPIFIPGFRDEVINNHDVRVYRDDKNQSVLLYGYWNQSTLVIARDPSVFSELMLRLASSRAQ
ncbi:MAG: hypothetical protein WC887_00075 [Candidatus Paceibacterota bacterium]|jgi:hypothetical protein